MTVYAGIRYISQNAGRFLPLFIFRIFGLGILITSLANILIVIGFHFHPFTDYAIIFLQILQGLALVSLFNSPFKLV